MKLYYKPGACSLASHIVLHELGGDFEIEKVDTGTQKTASGEDFSQVNPKGYVPALKLTDGQVLSEGAAILQYLADQKPELGLAPAAGTIERARLQEHLNYVASELHKSFGPFFSGVTLEGEARQKAEENVAKKMAYIETLLSDGREYLLGSKFSVADAYLFVVSNWSSFVGIKLDKVPFLAAFVTRVAGREKTQAALKAEGLLG
ncbi:glutathione transferase GstA [Kiloniella laminariae]|uniref:Glutathione transferase GstA n=1 Tax=Kiloniella laminariae TaxID=454162 RepID=A0ABT4LGU6_9PROT|nr:glutathione transferase GstA [Kiloniella laminariae]MCZ4280324.1 glutathione transferase GstA [Kiloniella laminariae]